MIDLPSHDLGDELMLLLLPMPRSAGERGAGERVVGDDRADAGAVDRVGTALEDLLLVRGGGRDFFSSRVVS